MDYKQKYFKYKQKYLNLLRDQKGGDPFLIDILAGQAFSYLFERNQRVLRLIYTNRNPVMMQPLGNFTLNPMYRLQLLSRSGLSILLATRLLQGKIMKGKLQLANRIVSCMHKLPKISPPTLATTFNNSTGVHDSVRSVAFHPTLPFLATGSENNAKLWRFLPDGSAQICVATLDSSNGGHTNNVESVTFHPTLPLLATGSEDKTAKLWRLVHTPNGSVATCVATLDRSNGGHSHWIYSVAFHPILPFLATGSYDNTAKLWRLVHTPDGSISAVTCVATLDRDKGGHKHNIDSVAFHPTLPLLATSSRDQTAKLWRFEPDGSAATCVATLDSSNNGHSHYVTSVTFHPTLPFLATGSDDKTAKLWRLVHTPDGSISAATCVATLPGYSRYVGSVAFHPTLPLLATSSEETTAMLWRFSADRSAPTCVATLGHSKSIKSIAFHSTLPLLATGFLNNTVKLWKL